MDTQTIEKLECMNGHLDGSHCGLSDWYPEIEKGIKKALCLGRDAVWTTGWYSSKKAIACACITHVDGEILVEVSVSDDLDSEGSGEVIIRHTRSLDKVCEAIDKAWSLAEENQKDNQNYQGFSVLHKHRVYSMYAGGKPVGKGKMELSWVETYLLPTDESDFPPGDAYYKWYWQGECVIPEAVKEKLAKWADEWTPEKGESFTYRGWTIKPWE